MRSPAPGPDTGPSLAGSPLAPHRHACAIVRSDDEASVLLVPFIDEAGRAGERVAYVAPRRRLAFARERLANAGLASRALGEAPPDEAALRGTVPATDWLWLVEGDYGAADAGRAVREADLIAGANALRIVVHLEPDATAGRERVTEHEASMDRLAGKGRRVIVCLYDVRFMAPARVVDAIMMHPLVVASGALYENSLYTPADRVTGAAGPAHGLPGSPRLTRR